MSERSPNSDSLTIRRAVRWTIGLFPVVLLGLIAVFCIQSYVPTWVYWNAGLLFLIMLEIAYGVSLSLAVLGALLFGALVVRGRRLGRSGPWSTLGLQLCGSVLLAAVVVEAACAPLRIREPGASPSPIDTPPIKFLTTSEPPIRTPVADVRLPTAFEDPAGDRDIDLVVLGDSSAEGVPFSRWSLCLANILAWKLQEAIPGRTIRQNSLAASGDTLKAQHVRLASVTRRPEILIVYSGNAEFCDGATDAPGIPRYVEQRAPRPFDALVARIERSSPVYKLLREGKEICRKAIPPKEGSTRSLVDEPIFTENETSTLLDDFRRRLETIVSYAEGLGAIPILIAPAGNDAGFEPNRSFLPANMPRAEREAFAHTFVEATRIESSDPDRAMGRFRALLARQPSFAEAHYRLAKLLEKKGEWAEAYRHYIAARDCDGLPVRCLTAFQQVYREVAARHDCILIDMQSYFRAIGKHGLLDDDLFQDAAHPSLRGNIALAQAVLQALYARRAFGWPKDAAVPFIDPSECADRFNLNAAAWKVVCFWEVTFEDRGIRWRYDPALHVERQVLYAQASDRIKAGAAPESLGLVNIGVPAPVPVELSARATERAPPRSRPGDPIRFESNPHR